MLRGLICFAEARIRVQRLEEREAVMAEVAMAMGAKALGAIHIYTASAAVPLSAVMFSSISSLLGNVGQANYASANSYMEHAAHAWRLQGVGGSSLQIPAVSGAGMGASTFSSSQLDEVGSITLDGFASCLWSMLIPSSSAGKCTQAALVDATLRNVVRAHCFAELPGATGSPSTAVTVAHTCQTCTSESELARALARLPLQQSAFHVAPRHGRS